MRNVRNLLARFRDLIVEYGVVALVVHYTVFTVVLVVFWAGIRLGWNPTDALASVGAWTAAYIATKITQPARILVTLAATPFVARAWERLSGRERRGKADEADRLS